MKILVIENNAGSLQLEEYDNDNLVSVVTGLEYAEPGIGIEDLATYSTDWYWNDCGGEIVGHNADGNTAGYTIAGSPITANDMRETSSRESEVVAEYEDGEMILYFRRMGSAAMRYFGLIKD